MGHTGKLFLRSAVMIKTDGIAEVCSESTGEVFEVEATALDWQGSGGDERGMGTEYLHSAEVEFKGKDGRLVSCEWTASEYPVGSLNHVTHHTGNAKLLRDFSFSWEHKPRDD
jgi:hypothetical protein